MPKFQSLFFPKDVVALPQAQLRPINWFESNTKWKIRKNAIQILYSLLISHLSMIACGFPIAPMIAIVDGVFERYFLPKFPVIVFYALLRKKS